MKRKLLIICSIFITLSSFSQSKKEIKKFLMDEKLGSVESESYIKFNYQNHERWSTTYNISFLGISQKSNNELSGIEFWGHGRKVLSIFGPIQINLVDEKRKDFVHLMISNYKNYQKNIRMKQKAFEHMDINLLEDENFVFSCYMNNRKTEYAFWVNKNKYPIDEKSLLELFLNFETYFQK